VNLVDEEFVVTLGEQTFTLPAGSFKANKKKDKFTCSKVNLSDGGVASATFNFMTCSFAITIKNVDITSSGDVELCVEFADFSDCVPVGLPCIFSISPTTQSFTAGGGSGSVTVTTSNGCDWTATSHASWIIITSSGSSDNGNGTVGYSVAANGGTANRTGTMTISGQTFTVTQAKPTDGSIWPSDGIVFRRNGTDIWVMNTDGSNPRELLSSEYNIFSPSSSPDGSKIVFLQYSKGIVVLDNSGEKVIMSYNLEAVDYENYVTWSYDGKIYFTAWNIQGEFIYSVNADGTGEVQVSPSYIDPELGAVDPIDYHPSISPDGLALLFSTNRTGNGGTIAKMAIGVGSITYLTYAGNVLGETVICPAEHPTWSPNGTKIAFAAYPGWPDFDAKEQIYVMNADGSGKVQLTSETGAHCRWPSWSPDGSKIVFQKDYPGFYNTTEIWIMNADGSGAKALTDRNVTFDGWPSFIKKPL
jgi:Tol biopolymer transport system component